VVTPIESAWAKAGNVFSGAQPAPPSLNIERVLAAAVIARTAILAGAMACERAVSGELFFHHSSLSLIAPRYLPERSEIIRRQLSAFTKQAACSRPADLFFGT